MLNVPNIQLPEMHLIYENCRFLRRENWLLNKVFGFDNQMHLIYGEGKKYGFAPNIQLPEMHLIYENFKIENAVRMAFGLKCT
jgi:hypothetical protein